MNNIIVIGYPKSGSTWLVRLIARMINCPSRGFLNQPEIQDHSIEGENRQSNYSCYKSHHQLKDLPFSLKDQSKKIIYIIRDPRDIVFSGIYFFQFHKKNFFYSMLRFFPKVRSIFYRLTTTHAYQVNCMIEAVLKGRSDIAWMNVSWEEHYKPYYDSGILFVRYEDLLYEPYEECHRILSYLNINRSNEKVIQAVKEESFEEKKRMYVKNKDKKRAHHMRRGVAGTWKECLSYNDKLLFKEGLEKSLKRFSYKV